MAVLFCQEMSHAAAWENDSCAKKNDSRFSSSNNGQILKRFKLCYHVPGRKWYDVILNLSYSHPERWGEYERKKDIKAIKSSVYKMLGNILSDRIFCSIILCLFLIPVTRSAHIVGFAKMAFVSHNRVLLKLGQELQMRGHKYTQILPNFAKEIFDDVDINISNTSVTSDDIQDWSLRLENVGNFDRDLYAIFEVLTKVVPHNNRIREQYCKDLLKHQDECNSRGGWYSWVWWIIWCLPLWLSRSVNVCNIRGFAIIDKPK